MPNLFVTMDDYSCTVTLRIILLCLPVSAASPHRLVAPIEKYIYIYVSYPTVFIGNANSAGQRAMRGHSWLAP